MALLTLVLVIGATKVVSSDEGNRTANLMAVLNGALPRRLFDGLDGDILALSSFDTKAWTASTKKIRWRSLLHRRQATYRYDSSTTENPQKASKVRWRVEQAVDRIAELANLERPDLNYTGAEWWPQVVAPNTGIYFHFDSDAGFHSHYMSSAAAGLAGLRKRASPEGGLALVPETSAVIVF